MDQVCKAETAMKFVSQYGGFWGFDGRDMVMVLKTKKAQAVAKRRIPDGMIRKETLDGKTVMVCRF